MMKSYLYRYLSGLRSVFILATVMSASAIFYYFSRSLIVAYGDAESHLNIAKRVVTSLTPGAAQLGGIWLPLPHLLMVPFVLFDRLWRSGLAGSIVSGVAFIISSLYLYKLTYLVTRNKTASFAAFLVFALNPNVLYMQSTPMTELPLIAFFILSTYYFFQFLRNNDNVPSLILAALFTFAASLTRYDGWFLALTEAGILALFFIFKKRQREEYEGKAVLFSTLAFFGIALWLLWDFLILGNPFYFTDSPFSARSQQQGWLARGELPTYKNIGLSFVYYVVTSWHNTGIPLFVLAVIGLALFVFKERGAFRMWGPVILSVPFVFYVATLYVGQSVVFIPDLTPRTYEWNLFNVRYGLMMVPFVAFFVGYLLSRSRHIIKGFVIAAFIFQLYINYRPGAPVPITLADGTVGLSSSKQPHAEKWMAAHYDHGLVLLDDYARTMSIIRSGVPMENVIYVGTKPYWEESLNNPARYATWIITQKNDTVWREIIDNPDRQGELYKYFKKVYTSPDILIFKRNSLK